MDIKTTRVLQRKLGDAKRLIQEINETLLDSKLIDMQWELEQLIEEIDPLIKLGE